MDELKQLIEQKTGVPASMLNGETVEENIAQAQAYLSYKREQENQPAKTTAEKFKAWLDAQDGIEEQDAASAALEEIAEAERIKAGGYPNVADKGEPVIISKDKKSAREAFAEWLDQKAAFNPFKHTL